MKLHFDANQPYQTSVRNKVFLTNFTETAMRHPKPKRGCCAY